MKQNALKVISTLLEVLLIAGLIYDVIKTDAAIGPVLAAIYAIALSLISLFYMYKGSKKNVAVWFKIYSIGILIMQAFVLVLMIVADKSVPCIISAALAVVACIILSFKKDLGKMASHFLGCFVVAVNLIGLIMKCGIHGFTHKNFFCFFSSLVLSFIYLACIHGKYIDKDERGTI